MPCTFKANFQVMLRNVPAFSGLPLIRLVSRFNFVVSKAYTKYAIDDE